MMRSKRWMWQGAAPVALAVFAAVCWGSYGAAVHAADPATPTYTKDIAPIFQQKCESCHRADGMAPMSLATYDDARPYAKSIAQRVSTHAMPPWQIDRTIGIQKFKNDRSLTDGQIATVVAWVNGGAPRGSAADMPAAMKWPDGQGWVLPATYGEPDHT